MEGLPISAAPAPAPSPEIVFQTLLAYQQSAALCAAIDLDLFRAVGEGAGDAASLALRCQASERGVRILCDYLTVHGFLNKDEGRWTLTPVSAVFLDTRSPHCMASISRFLNSPVHRASYDNLTEVVRLGHTLLPGQGSVEPENTIWVEFARSMVPMVGSSAGPLAELVLDGRRGPLRVLDIAAGHGMFGIEVARRNPEARVTALDWAPVLAIARENATHAGLDGRFGTLAGNAFDTDFGGLYDIVLLTNFLHHFDPATNESLLRKVRAALRPGGVAAALEFVPNDDRVSPAMPAAFSMTMLGTTQAGDAYTFAELHSMFRNAGFVRSTLHPMPHGPQTVVLAHTS